MKKVATNKVQKKALAPQKSKGVNSRKRIKSNRSRKSAHIRKNIMEKTVSPEPNNTLFQNASPIEVPEVTNEDVINTTSSTDDHRHENVHFMSSKSIDLSIENDCIVDITDIAINNIAQNDFQPIPSIMEAPKFENDEVIDITNLDVIDNKTVTKESTFIVSSSDDDDSNDEDHDDVDDENDDNDDDEDDDVQFISYSSNARNIIDIITLNSSEDEENIPHEQPVEKSVDHNKSFKERLDDFISLTKTNKRKYNSPLRNFKRSKADDLGPNFLNSDLGGFVIDKQSISNFSNNLENIGQKATLSQNHLPLSSTSSMENKKLRPIIIDGLNIGHAHGGPGNFSVKGIELCITYFANRGHSDIIAFLPQHRQGVPGSEANTLLNQLLKKGHICFTPSRKVQNLRMTCHDDRIILDYANQCDGVVVSNDNYRDLYNEKDTFKDIIENRQVMVTFVRDKIIVPEDQYNRKCSVRSLSDILCFPS